MKGEMYCIQLIQLERFEVFLKKPENSKKGKITKRVNPLTAFASLTILPTKRPKDIPAKFNRKIINQKVQNCSAEASIPTNQYMMSAWREGKMRL